MVAYSYSFSTQARALPRLIEAKIILVYDPPGLLKNSLTRKKASTPARLTRHPRRAIVYGSARRGESASYSPP